MRYHKMWFILALITLSSFSIVGYFGYRIYLQAPPIPNQVVTTTGNIIFTKADIETGQAVWQSTGGQELGTVWGHGSYLAPDWSADWLHRESISILNTWATKQYGNTYDQISTEQQAALRARLQKELRTNTYNPSTGKLIISPIVAQAIQQVSQYIEGLFGNDPQLAGLRNNYAMLANTVPSFEQQRALSAFFFWTSWATVTDRPGQQDLSYTSNWPAERLVGNAPPPSLIIISAISVVLLLAGVGAMAWYHAFSLRSGYNDPLPDQPVAFSPTPSMKATYKFFLVVIALFLVQIACGIITAHYTAEGTSFYGLPIAQWFPYTVTRTWHIQTALFWIATSLLATGLFVAPTILGEDPKFQRAAVNFIWVCLLIIVVGSMAGEWLTLNHKLNLTHSFWFGEQGYEYIDLGRFWQAFLYVGLLLWLVLMLRCILPVIKRNKTESTNLLVLFFLSCFTIGGFYGFGLLWGQYTNIAIEEYWRWWVVHLWVEGFFEVFTTVAIAFLFTRLGLLKISTATQMALLATIIYLVGGVIGIFHHLYFTGTPSIVIVLGGIFSALEVVPLTLMGFDAYHNLRLSHAQPWVQMYKWPIYFFIGVCFWNLVGAGLFGFLINMPIILYYTQGLNTTPLHAHAALYGVYGNLAIGLLLFCLKGLTLNKEWHTKSLKAAFWLLNSGIAAMCFLSLLPIGLLQAWASVAYDMWYARSPAFTASTIVHNFIWVRVFGDVLFAAGAFCLTFFVLRLTFSPQQRER